MGNCAFTNACFFQLMHSKDPQQYEQTKIRMAQMRVKVWTMAFCREMFDHDINAFTDNDFIQKGLEGRVKSGVIAQTEVAQQTIKFLLSFLKKKKLRL